jgi:His Kinase A (phospho-acceptor) domain
MQFVAAISHELRTPVSSISMLSRNQVDGLVSGTDKVLQYGELIHQQSRRLSEMIEQTLQYAGIHSHLGTRTRTSVDVEAVITAALAAHKVELTREHFMLSWLFPTGFPQFTAMPACSALPSTICFRMQSNTRRVAGGSASGPNTLPKNGQLLFMSPTTARVSRSPTRNACSNPFTAGARR